MTRTARYALTLVVGTLAVLVGAVVVMAGESNIADSFPTAGSYSGNTGLQSWNGPWVEETESDGAGAGDITVASTNCPSSSCLGVDHILLKSHSIHRVADLAGAESATLRISLSKSGLGTGSIRVQAVGSTTVAKNIQVTSETPQTVELDISAAISGSTRIRFETFGIGVLAFKVFVDNVRIDLVYPDATTTTTTTTLAPTTTTTLAATSTTSAPPTSATTRPTTTTTLGSTTTTAGEPGTTTTVPPAPSGSDQSPPSPATGLDLDLARLSGVTLNMAQEAPTDLGFRFGVNPVTGLTVNFSSVVEIIKAEFLSALGLGTMVAFFAVGGWKREDEEEDITS